MIEYSNNSISIGQASSLLGVSVVTLRRWNKLGEMNEFKAGIEKIVTMTNAPVIPVGLKGVYGSMFSRKHKVRVPRTIFRKITLEIGEKIEPENLNKEFLQEKVKELLER